MDQKKDLTQGIGTYGLPGSLVLWSGTLLLLQLLLLLYYTILCYKLLFIIIVI